MTKNKFGFPKKRYCKKGNHAQLNNTGFGCDECILCREINKTIDNCQQIIEQCFIKEIPKERNEITEEEYENFDVFEVEQIQAFWKQVGFNECIAELKKGQK